MAIARSGLLVAVVMVAVVIPASASEGFAAVRAQAQPPSVPVPRHDAPAVQLALLGASSSGVAITGDDVFSFINQTVFTGAEGGSLTDRGPLVGKAPDVGQRLGVVGRELAWYEVLGQTSTTPESFILHRTDLITGADSSTATTLRPIAFTGDAWLAYSGSSLVRTVFGGARSTLLTGVTNPVGLATDPTGALLASTDPIDGNPRQYRLDLIEFATGTVERIVDSTTFIGSIDLSATTVVWATQSIQGTPQLITQRPRAGGAISTYSESDDYADDSPKVAADGRVAYLVPDPAGAFLRVVTGSSDPSAAAQIPLPLHPSGLAALGGRFLTAVSGPVATAGVYAIDGTDVARVATTPTPPLPVTAIAFSDSRLYYADESYFYPDLGLLDDVGPMAVWERTVSAGTGSGGTGSGSTGSGSTGSGGTGSGGAGPPQLSAETQLPQRAAYLYDIAPRSVSFSAGRGAIGLPRTTVFRWQLLDRGAVTGTVQQPLPLDYGNSIDEIHPNTSGPFTLVKGSVYRPDGSLVFTRPGEGSIQSSQDDLFGPQLIYSDLGPSSHRGEGQIWLRDVTAPKTATNPRLLATVHCTDFCPALVSIWGDTAAWMADSRHIAVRTLDSTRTRLVPTGGPVSELELGEGTLAWQAPGTKTRLLDLTQSGSVPIALAGSATTVTLDDHWLARKVTDTQRVVVYRLPFGGAYRPRLIGTLAAAGFTPNGDGTTDTWAPAFDVTKPLTAVTLRIKGGKSGRTLRTLTGTGPDGSIRDLVWNGRSGAGTALAAGTYRWQLSAQAEDGEGALTAANGAATISGTVQLVRAG